MFQALFLALRASEINQRDKTIALKEVKHESVALAGVAQWIEHQPVNQRAAGWIPSQGTSFSCGPGPQLGAHERQPHIDVSLPLFLFPFPSV